MRSLKFIIAFTICIFIFSCNKKKLNAYVRLENEGCFGAKKSELFFYKGRDSTLVILSEDDKETQRTLVGEGQIAALSYFRQKIEALHNSESSTVVQHFMLESGDVKIKKTNYGYNDDFDRLKAVLFKSKK
ncbi:MAG: hypothetical protein U0V75_06850 [Ferruginibacter sp.]